MFVYPMDYDAAKKELFTKIDSLKKEGRSIFHKQHPIIDDLVIDRITIKAKKNTKNRVILNCGLHGIEGYVGHAAMMTFLEEFLPKLTEDTDVILYHPLNPFGMKNFRRTNEENVDLNRNFTTNHFSSENEGYVNAQHFFKPQKYKGIKRANLSFYSTAVKLIAKYGVPTLKEATLMGQKIQPDGLYYSGTTHQKTTLYMLDEIPKNLVDVEQIVWIDLHTGYGPRYQMSIVNSIFEKEDTKEMIDKINYPRVLGLNKDDFYEIDGDMIEMIYRIHKDIKSPASLYATCFEFGTLGEPLLKSVESLKSMIFENSSYFIEQTPAFKEYSDHLIKEQYLPSEEAWRQKAHEDFHQAIDGILSYKKLLKKEL